MGKEKEYTADQVMKAIKDSYGIISTIAERLGCSWSTASKYCQNWNETKQAMESETETVLDMAETTLVTALKNGDIQASKWILSTKGRKRGYGESIEVTGDIPAVVMTREERRKRIEELHAKLCPS